MRRGESKGNIQNKERVDHPEGRSVEGEISLSCEADGGGGSELTNEYTLFTDCSPLVDVIHTEKILLDPFVFEQDISCRKGGRR